MWIIQKRLTEEQGQWRDCFKSEGYPLHVAEDLLAQLAGMVTLEYRKVFRGSAEPKCSCTHTQHERMENRSCPVHFPIPTGVSCYVGPDGIQRNSYDVQAPKLSQVRRWIIQSRVKGKQQAVWCDCSAWGDASSFTFDEANAYLTWLQQEMVLDDYRAVLRCA